MGYTKFDFKSSYVNRTYVYGDINFNKQHIIDSNKKMSADIDKNYGTIIDKWAKEFDIDRGIIISFIATESGGKNAGKNKFDAVGLMQVTPNTIYEFYTKWDKQVSLPLSVETKIFFKNKISSTPKWSSNRSPTSTEKAQILTALTNVEYNIASGTLCIRWLIEAFSKIGDGGLDKVMVAYNSGFYGKKDKIKGMNASELVNATKLLSFETRAYILKMLGVNGFISLYYKLENK
jgi:hypothetical protein